MFSKKQFSFLIVFFLFLSQIFILGINFHTSKHLEINSSEIKQFSIQNSFLRQDDSFSIKTSSNKSWTYMLYLDADNDIEGDAIRDFEWLEEAGGSDENLSIVVLLDRIPEYDNTHGNWNGSRIYNVTKNLLSIAIDSQLMEDLGEVNMANPTTLTNFIIYCFENFPAENYILDLWDHGHAAYGVIDDETSGSHFIIDDVQTAVGNALANTTEELDIISMDACNMNTLETAWELRNLCKYFMSSEDTTNGYPYKSIIKRLKLNPFINASSLCELMVDAYSKYYSSSYGSCLSVINQTKLLDIPSIINSFISELITTLENGLLDDVFAISRETALDLYDDNWVDLISLIENIIEMLDKPALHLVGEALLDFLGQLIIYNWQHKNYYGAAHGLTIFMPNNSESYEFLDDYCNGNSFCNNMDWQTDILWDEFLDFCWENGLFSVSKKPLELSLDEAVKNCVIEQNVTQIYQIVIFPSAIFEFTCQISQGDIDFRIIKYDYVGNLDFIGGSYLINPDDGKIESSRFYLKSSLYYILVFGRNSVSNYEIEVKKCEPILLLCNDPYTETSGSRNGDTQGHYKQDLGFYFQINMTFGNNTILLRSSETASYQLTIFSVYWGVRYFLPAEGYGEILTLFYNHTSIEPKTFFIEIFCIDGVGEFTLEVKNPNQPTPKIDVPYFDMLLSFILIAFLSSAVFYLSNRRKNCFK